MTITLSYLLACLGLLLIGAVDSFAQSMTFNWNAPTTNQDGTPLNDLAGYKLHYGTSSRNYSVHLSIGNVTQYTLTNLTPGPTYFFAVTAVDTSGNESVPSNEVSRKVAARCDLDGTGNLTVSDVQLCVNQVVGSAACANGDVNGDGQCNVSDVQKVVNGLLGGSCP